MKFALSMQYFLKLPVSKYPINLNILLYRNPLSFYIVETYISLVYPVINLFYTFLLFTIFFFFKPKAQRSEELCKLGINVQDRVTFEVSQPLGLWFYTTYSFYIFELETLTRFFLF